MAVITAPGVSVARNTVQTILWSSITQPVHAGVRSDWFGLYLTTALDSEPTTWQYTDGTAAGSGALFIPDGLALLTYELRLFSGHTQTKIATSASFTMTAGTPTTLTIPATASANTTITVSWAGIAAPQSTDYIECRTASLQLFAAGPVLTGGAAAGSVLLSLPNAMAADTYRAYLWRAAVPDLGLAASALALSGTMVVSSTNVVTLTGSGNQLAGATATVTWANIGSPAAGDWLGLFLPGGTLPLGWRPTLGTAGGAVPFQLPSNLATATYELRCYRAVTQELLATSAPFTITAVA